MPSEVSTDAGELHRTLYPIAAPLDARELQYPLPLDTGSCKNPLPLDTEELHRTLYP